MKRLGFRHLVLVFIPLVAVACSSSGLQLPQSPLLAALERKSGRIVYVGADGNIHTIDQGGGNPEAITDDALVDPDGDEIRFYDFPTWSTEDDRIAFIGYRASRDGETSSSIYTAGGRAEEPKEIYTSDLHVPIYLYWSSARTGMPSTAFMASCGNKPACWAGDPSIMDNKIILGTGSERTET
jgi:hypothetical protein